MPKLTECKLALISDFIYSKVRLNHTLVNWSP